MAIALDFKRTVIPWFSGERPTFATVLTSSLLKIYGSEALNWDAQTIQLQVKEDFNVDMPRRVFDQLMGQIAAITSTAVYNDVIAFDAYASAVNRLSIRFDHDTPDPGDIAWAVAELAQVDPEPVGVKGWSPDIIAYIRVVLDDAGLPIPPKVLKFVPPRPPQSNFSDSPDLYAASWASQEALATEVDQHVDELTLLMLADLAKLGIKPYGEQPEKPKTQFGHGEQKLAGAKSGSSIFAQSLAAARRRLACVP
jgi:hypothetical protein